CPVLSIEGRPWVRKSTNSWEPRANLRNPTLIIRKPFRLGGLTNEHTSRQRNQNNIALRYFARYRVVRNEPLSDATLLHSELKPAIAFSSSKDGHPLYRDK